MNHLNDTVQVIRSDCCAGKELKWRMETQKAPVEEKELPTKVVGYEGIEKLRHLVWTENVDDNLSVLKMC